MPYLLIETRELGLGRDQTHRPLAKRKEPFPLLEEGVLRTKPSEISTHKLHIIVLRSWIPRA